MWQINVLSIISNCEEANPFLWHVSRNCTRGVHSSQFFSLYCYIHTPHLYQLLHLVYCFPYFDIPLPIPLSSYLQKPQIRLNQNGGMVWIKFKGSKLFPVAVVAEEENKNLLSFNQLELRHTKAAKSHITNITSRARYFGYCRILAIFQHPLLWSISIFFLEKEAKEYALIWCTDCVAVQFPWHFP